MKLIRIFQAFAIGVGCYAGYRINRYLGNETFPLDLLVYFVVVLVVFFTASLVGKWLSRS